MTAEEARKITHDHSKRMKYIYAQIKSAAEAGSTQVVLFTNEVSKSEWKVLESRGYTVEYLISEIDGGQSILIKW